MCALVREGAGDRRTRDTTLGVILAFVGGATTAASTALVAQGSHTPTYTGEWGASLGIGVAASAAAIYFLTKAGNDRQEYWLANAAVAKINADYAQYPTLMSDPLMKTLNEWKAATSEGDKSAKLEAFRREFVKERSEGQTYAGVASDVDVAEEFKILATREQAAASALSAADAAASAALADYQKLAGGAAADDTQGGKPGVGGGGEAKPVGGASAGGHANVDPDVLKAAKDRALASVKAAAALHTQVQIDFSLNKETEPPWLKLNDIAALSAAAAANNALAADRANVVTGLQAAWTDCSTALQAIGSADAAAFTSAAAALGAAGSASKSGSSTTSGGGH
jgi:hypothetical protein